MRHRRPTIADGLPRRRYLDGTGRERQRGHGVHLYAHYGPGRRAGAHLYGTQHRPVHHHRHPPRNRDAPARGGIFAIVAKYLLPANGRQPGLAGGGTHGNADGWHFQRGRREWQRSHRLPIFAQSGTRHLPAGVYPECRRLPSAGHPNGHYWHQRQRRGQPNGMQQCQPPDPRGQPSRRHLGGSGRERQRGHGVCLHALDRAGGRAGPHLYHAHAQHLPQYRHAARNGKGPADNHIYLAGQ